MNKQCIFLCSVFLMSVIYASEKKPIIAIYSEDFIPVDDQEEFLFQELEQLPRRLFVVDDTNLRLDGKIIKYIHQGQQIIGKGKRNENNTKITFIPALQEDVESISVQCILDNQLFFPGYQFFVFGYLSPDSDEMEFETINSDSPLFAELKKDDQPYLVYFIGRPLTLKMKKELRSHYNEDTRQLLYNVCTNDDHYLLEEFVKQDKTLLNYNFNGATPLLIMACQNNAVQVVRYLLYNGVDPNQSDAGGTTLPLIEAIKAKSLSLLYELFLYGANRHIRSEECVSPFDYLYQEYMGDKHDEKYDQKLYEKMISLFVVWKSKKCNDEHTLLAKKILGKCKVKILLTIAQECGFDARQIFMMLLQNDKIAEVIYLIKNMPEYPINLADHNGMTLLQHCLNKELNISYETREFIIRLLLERFDLPELVVPENNNEKTIARKIEKSQFFSTLSPRTKEYILECCEKRKKKFSSMDIIEEIASPKRKRSLRNLQKKSEGVNISKGAPKRKKSSKRLSKFFQKD